MRSHDLAPSLEEFGLSRYEAKAYLTLLGKGPLSASEVAYYSNLPRTKVYSTLTKLSKKGLVIITQDKPLVCTAVSPNDAFGELLVTQENKIGDMKTMIAKLEKIGEESIKPHGAKECSYLVLGPDLVLTTLKELILDAKEEIACVIDSWGLRIISECKNAMLKSLTNKIDIKILAGKDCLDNDMLSSIPYGASVRVGDGDGANLFVLDKSIVVMVNSNNGKGALFRSAEILSDLHSRIFNTAWANGMDASALMQLERELAKTIMKLINGIHHDAYRYLANSVINDDGKQQDMLQLLESDGVKLSTIGLFDMLKVINAALTITCSASLIYDKNSGIITIESHTNGRQVMPWVLLLTNYLARNDISATTLAGTSNGKGFVRIKLAEKLTLQ